MRRFLLFLSPVLAILGCFSDVDRSKIGDHEPFQGSGDLPREAGGKDPAISTGEAGADAPLAPSSAGCSAKHDFCVDFDGAGQTPTELGFDEISAGERGTGSVSIEAGGRSAPRCARVTTPNDPVNAPGLYAGLLRTIDGTRGFELAFDVEVQAPDWTGYGEESNFKIALVSTAHNTVTLSLHILHPPAGGGPNQLGIVFVDPADQGQQSFVAFPYGAWVHVDVAVAPTGILVKVDGKTGFTRGAVAFDQPGRAIADGFALGSIRDTDRAPATDVRIDNIVFDYR